MERCRLVRPQGDGCVQGRNRVAGRRHRQAGRGVSSSRIFGRRRPEIPGDRMSELSTARVRLMGFLDHGGRERLPQLAAHAQGTYDCWVEEEWEEEADIACRKEFMRLETQFTAQAVAPPVVAGTAMNSRYQVFFDFDRSNISPDAAKNSPGCRGQFGQGQSHPHRHHRPYQLVRDRPVQSGPVGTPGRCGQGRTGQGRRVA